MHTCINREYRDNHQRHRKQNFHIFEAVKFLVQEKSADDKKKFAGIRRSMEQTHA